MNSNRLWEQALIHERQKVARTWLERVDGLTLPLELEAWRTALSWMVADGDEGPPSIEEELEDLKECGNT